ncbi:MAG: aerobic-type carbon monoxide dehydrogenase, middle subunit CoxM/CutM-like protein [Rhodospirillales bacterium]|nr:aerobic-type carbon monoxide dehydrogenase, middle subunit CoxM/CutM-like protein [Rhodospirillales bacterium]
MRPFTYARPAALDAVAREFPAASAGTATGAPVQFLGAGTNLLDLMKLDVMRPSSLVDLTGIDAAPLRRIEATPSELRLGALVRMAEAAEDPVILRDYPVLAQALQLAASQQLRNMATLGGNVLQRTRCLYYRDTAWANCNKRNPGSGCAAREGVDRQHAVLGASEHCIATYPGDFAQALIALDAQVETQGPKGRRRFPFAELHKLPGDTPHLDHSLAAGEAITGFTVPAGPWTRRSLYLKIRDRASYEFALASAAVALQLEGTQVRAVRIALGGVATVPWRAREAEAALIGVVLDETTAAAAADAAFAKARPNRQNAFKVPLGKQTLVRALLTVAAKEG